MCFIVISHLIVIFRPLMCFVLFQRITVHCSGKDKCNSRRKSILDILSSLLIDFNTGIVLCSVGIFTCNRDANAERMAEHCLESGCIGKYIPLQPGDFPRGGILHPSAISRALGYKIPAIGKSRFLGGRISQYIPPLGSVQIQYIPPLDFRLFF